MYPEHYGQYEPEPPVAKPSVLKRFLHFTREILETIVPAVLIALLINLFLAQATRVYGQSMEPNLHTDQRLIVEKLTYNRYFRQYLGLDGPERGDVVVIDLVDQGGELLIKRVVGLPGDTVEITIRFRNVGPVPIGNVKIIDSLAGRLEYVEDSQRCSLRALFTGDDNLVGSEKLRWEIREELTPGDGGEIRFECLVR